jgi:nicotinamidase-related amidase
MSTVLVAMHYQNEVIHAGGKIKVGVAERAEGRGVLVANAARLLAMVRGARIPVVSVRIAFRPDHADVIANCAIFRNVVASKAMVDGEWGAEFHEGLEPREGEFVVKHTRVNAFYGSQLEETLRVLKAERLIMAGVATNSVVLTTVACAADMGYEVVVVSDACSSGNSALHESSLENMRLVADVVAIDELAARIQGA